MKSKLLSIFLVVALITLGGQVLYLLHKNTITRRKIEEKAIKQHNRMSVAHAQRIHEMERKYEREKHLATGTTVFDRIFNTQDQTITNLIRRTSREAFPNVWTCDVKVEEFTHFILLIYIPHDTELPKTKQIVRSLRPVIKYCNEYLTDMAVFDQQHKSFLFFDKAILKHLKSGENITKSMEITALKQGRKFKLFNSVTVQCEKHKSHLWLPIQISGSNGVVECLALLDTGASTTTLASDIITRTGRDNLQSAPNRRFSTANGSISCPIVHREVNVGGLRKNIEVAVNQQDQLTLLGMNYFEGMEYIIDFGKSAIHMWAK